MAVAVLLVSLPVSSMGGGITRTTFHSPYNGKSLGTTQLTTLGCGNKDSIAVKPKFTLSTGQAKFTVRSHSKSCGSPLGYNDGSALAGIGYFTRSLHGLSGLHHVVVRWSLVWSSVLNASRGPTLSGNALSTSFLVATLYLLDTTNGTYLLPANHWSWFVSDRNGTLSTTGHANVSMYLNQTLVSPDYYVIDAAIDGTSYSWTSSQGPSTAVGSLALGVPGNPTKLTSITLT